VPLPGLRRVPHRLIPALDTTALHIASIRSKQPIHLDQREKELGRAPGKRRGEEPPKGGKTFGLIARREARRMWGALQGGSVGALEAFSNLFLT
jgi:hypothetical protein